MGDYVILLFRSSIFRRKFLPEKLPLLNRNTLIDSSWSPVSSLLMLSWKLSVLEIPLDKELTANCLEETRTKLEELIPAAIV